MKKRQHKTANNVLTASEAYQRSLDRKSALEKMGYETNSNLVRIEKPSDLHKFFSVIQSQKNGNAN